MKLCSLFITLILSFSASNAQLRWIVEPILDTKSFQCSDDELFDYIIIKYDDKTSKVINRKGKTLLERDKWIRDFNRKPGAKLIAFRRADEKFNFYTPDFECVTKDFDEARMHQEYQTLTTTKNDLLGLIDFEGNVLIENKYKLLKRKSSGKFKAITEDGTEKILTIKDKPNPENFPDCTFQGNTIYRETAQGRTSPIGIINAQGDTIVHHSKYSSFYFPRCPTVYLDSFIMVSTVKSKKIGLINLKGDLVVDTIYKSMKTVESVPYLMNVRIDKPSSVLDLRTQTVSNYGYDNAFVGNSGIIVKKGKFQGLLDFDGNEIIPPTYHSVTQKKNSNMYIRNDSIFIYSKKKKAFSKDIFTKQTYANSETYILGNGKSHCLYDGGNLDYLTEPNYKKIRKVRDYFECTYLTYDTTYYDPPREVKNRKGEVTRTYSKSTRQVSNYEFRNSDGELMYGPIQRELKILNDTYSKHYIAKTDSVAFVNTKTFQAKKFLSSEVDNVKYGVGHFVKGVIQANSSNYILDHYLDQSIDAIPYDTLISEKRSGVYIYGKGEKFGLVSRDAVLTGPEFDSIERISDNYIVEVKGKYGLLEVKED